MKLGLKTKNTLKLISQLPLIILFVASCCTLYISFDQYKSANKLKKQISNTKILNNLAINMGNELEIGSIYLNSKGEMNQNIINKQYALTNKSIEDFKSAFNTSEHKKLLKKIGLKLEKLEENRIKILSTDPDFRRELFEYYASINQIILDHIKDLKIRSFNQDLTLLGKSLLMAYENIEYLGQERYLILQMLIKGKKLNKNETLKWLNVLEKTKSFNLDYLPHGSTQKSIKHILDQEKNKMIFENVKSIKSDLTLSISNGNPQTKPNQWFLLMNDKINIFKTIADKIQKDLNAQIDKYNFMLILIFIAASILCFLSLILMLIGFSLSKQNAKNITKLEQIFKATKSQEKLDLQSLDGTNKAYNIIHQSIENMEEDKRVAQREDAAKSLFLANISHGIRTPLNGIIGFTELLKGTDIQGEKLEFVEIIEKSSEDLLKVLNEVLDLSKIQSNKTKTENMLFSPMEEFENAVELYGPKAAEKNIRLNFFMDPSLSNKLIGDLAKVKEVIINLLSNAVKFTPENGNIDVNIKRIGHCPTTAKVYFSVEDNGIGIQNEKLNQIFDPFSQEDDTIAKKYGGTGLGLSISSELVSLMGGKLEVSSKKGQGSKFFFTLKFEEVSSDKAEEKNPYLDYQALIFSKDENDLKYINLMKDYLGYFNIQTNVYENLDQLEKYIKNGFGNILFLNFDLLGEEKCKKYAKMQIPSILIIKPTYQNRLEEFNTKYITPVFEPLNATKLIKALDKHKKLISSVTIPSPTKEQKDILIFKKSPIESKIFTILAKKLDLNSDCSQDLNDFMSKIKNEKYSIILFDYEIENIDLDAVSKQIKISQNQGTTSILFADTLSTIEPKIDYKFTKIIQEPIDKIKLENIIKEYI
ncbi:MAG: hypothetical protein CR967_03990 [Proteobacteria bacterium]|nr:MAG: hypothetical protein CR967_03990 [Pseudomonadota bacterium]